MSEQDATRFRKQADECGEQALKAVSPLNKEAWLRVAEECPFSSGKADIATACDSTGGKIASRSASLRIAASRDRRARANVSVELASRIAVAAAAHCRANR
jgi:hypothetical protein